MLVSIAFGAILAGGAKSARAAVADEAFCAGSAAALAIGDDQAETESPPPIELNDDDDDEDEEVSAEPARAVPIIAPSLRRAAPKRETIRSSLGHPRGIDDPPRF